MAIYFAKSMTDDLESNLNGKADGVMGTQTHHAISKFQKDKKLAVNGKFDSQTRQMLSQNAGQAGK